MGDTGPCGPCSELHFHQGDHLPCAEVAAGRACLGPACECDRWLEIWNLVFMQFNRDASGDLTPLPRPSIDTGMGLERIAAVLQGKLSSYETDLFAPLIGRVARAGRQAATAPTRGRRRLACASSPTTRRTATFLIADGVTPSNEWRGYVLRRIMRRAMRHGRMLGLTEPFLWKTVGWVGDADGRAPTPRSWPSAARIEDTVRGEEERFAETLDSGDAADRRVSRGAGRRARGRGVDGGFLFTLYDTYGFPRDLAEDVLEEHGWVVTDETERDVGRREMEAQRERARAGGLVRRRGDASETTAVYQRLSRRAAAPWSSSATRRWPRRRRILALVRGRAAGARGDRGRRGRGDPRPHAGLRRVGRPGGRHRHADRARRAAARSWTPTTAAPS